MPRTPPPDLGKRRPVAAVVFRYVHHYRAGFYERLRLLLRDQGVELRLLVGRPGPRDHARRDAVTIPWATPIDTRYVSLGHRELCWQSCLSATWDADLVVVEQASRLLVNYVLLAARGVGGPMVAFWGQGAHVMPHRASRTAEAVKSSASRRVDWWFAYNEASAQVVESLGFPAERVTNVQNAVDTRALKDLRDGLSAKEVDAARRRLGIAGEHAGVFVGTLYAEKRLPFLVAAADVVRSRMPDFELVVVGSGADECGVRAAAESRPWMHYAGALRGRDKVAAMACARAYLSPGAVGLGVLDAFALELPPVTTELPFNGHESAYLAPGRNSLIVGDWRSAAAYADAVVRVMTDDALLAHLREGCRAAAETYTVESMSERFAQGVCDALRVGRRRGVVRT